MKKLIVTLSLVGIFLVYSFVIKNNAEAALPVQVQAAITNETLTDISFLQYPLNRGHSLELSTYTLPILKQEAIQSQNALVDMVSRATQTSKGFIESLQTALNKAKS